MAIMEAMLFSSTDFKTKLHLSSRESPRSGETRIERPWSTLFRLLGKLPLLAGLATVLFADRGTGGYTQLCPGQLCGAADAADQGNGAIHGGADRWGSECCDRGMERFDRAGQFTDRLQRQRLSVGSGPNGADGLGPALASYLLREEHFGCHGRRERCDGDVQCGSHLSGHSDLGI